MIKHNIRNIGLLIILLFTSSVCFSAIKPYKSEKEKLIEELTGVSSPKTLGLLPKSASIPARHLRAGIIAYKEKKYISALKHYNSVIHRYAKSKEVKAAYLAKAKLYNEIGLQDQAQLNSKLATKYGNKILK